MNALCCAAFLRERRAMAAAGCLATAMVLSGVAASAATITFSQITSNGTESPAGQLTAEVSDSGGQVLFKFVNAAGGGSIASRISEVYWDDDLGLLSNGPVVDGSNTSAGVVLTSIPASPANVPAGNTVGFNADFSAGRVMAAANGVDPGEMAAFLFDGDTTSVLAALAAGDMRLGMHVISIGAGGQSESFVGHPEPSSAVLLAAASLAVASRRRAG